MQKFISFILALLFCITCILPCVKMPVSAAGLVMPEQLGGIENVMLMYTFANQGAVSGRHTVETLLPYVGYYNPEGELEDIFFDSFLLLPCVTTGPSGGTMYRSSNPAIASDWDAYLTDVFRDGYNLDSLNKAVGQVKRELGLNGFKAKIFFTVLYPNEGQTNFGTLDGRKYNFSSLQDRIDICKWQVDNYIELFNSGSYENLELYGFYWFEEFISVNSSAEKSLITSTTSYVRDKGYKSIWIPYYKASGYSSWANYGFDVACLQPNYMFNANAESDRVKNAVDLAKKYGMCNEMEASGSILTSAEYYNRYLTYLKDFAANGAMNAVKMYYQDVRFYYTCFKSELPEARYIYDLTYKYASGSLKSSDVEGHYLTYSGVSSKYNIVSAGCSYTATKPFTDTTNGYGDIDGTELTDSIYSTTSYGTEYHAFHRNTVESDGNFQITVDLGGVYDDLQYIYTEFHGDKSASIGIPSNVTYYTSVDGKNFTLLKKVDVTGNIIGAPAGTYEGSSFTARYVKAVFPPDPTASFIFVPEISIGNRKFDGALGQGYDIVSIGCEYTAFKPYTDTSEWDAPYKHIDGKELTDGILGSSDVGTEWYDMYSGDLKEGEKFYITVDLGEIRNNVVYFGLQFGDDLSYGISKPDNVTVSVSEDGKNFTPVGTVSVVKGNDGYAYAELCSEKSITARYVKAEFTKGESVHHFVSEFFIGVSEMNTQPTPPEIEEHIKGDTNLSGKFELADYLLAKRASVGNAQLSPTAFAAADSNQDGKIDNTDFNFIKQAFIRP